MNTIKRHSLSIKESGEYECQKTTTCEPVVSDVQGVSIVPFSDLTIGDRFRVYGTLWTKIEPYAARKHSCESVELGSDGYGYLPDPICGFLLGEEVEFVKPLQDVIDKLEFKSNTIGEKDSELAEVVMQEAADEIKRLRQVIVDIYSCKYEADKMVILIDREYQKNKEIYKQIIPFDCLR